MSTKADIPVTKPEVPQTKGPKPTTAPTISYELYAPRSNEQRSRLMRIHDLTVGPKLLSSEDAKDDSECCTFQQAISPEEKVSFQRDTPPKPPSNQLDSGSFIYSKFQYMDSVEETKILTQALSQAQTTSRHISKIIQSSTTLHNALVQTTTLAKGISARHEALLQHSSELSQAAERLQSESDQLAQHAEEIGLPLKHYDAVDHLGIQVGVLFKNGTVVNGLAKIKVDDDGFVQVLDDIDAAVRFFAERSEWTTSHLSSNGNSSSNNRGDSTTSGSVEYYKRALMLQEAALDLFKEAIVVRMTQTAMQVSSALDLTRKSINGDTLEASLIYTRFHGISSRSRRLLQIIQTRMGTIYVPARKVGEYVCPYTELWNLCRNTYVQVRESLLKLSVRNHLDHLKEKHGLIGMTRLASVFLMRLCTVETSLYLDFFGKEAEIDVNGTTPSESERVKTKPKKDSAALASQVMSKDGTYYDLEFQGLLDTLCNNLHRTIRRGMVSILDLDALCQIVSVLREERSLANSSPTTMAAARSLGRVIVDAQERLIFCANSVLGKEVSRFKATPEDLDYPDKLRRFQDQANEKNDTNQQDSLQQQMKIYESWFPPIRSVLKVLSRIFRVVEPKVFEDIALSSVQSCCKSLKDGSVYIEKKSGELHSDLFLVKHLLVS
jgi:conserved oligomeric Golgi complex subunit 3